MNMQALVLGVVVAFAAIVITIRYRRKAGTSALHGARTANEAGGEGAEGEAVDKIPGSAHSSEVAAWIWKNLVPRSGQSLTVQGELLRAVEKLRWEAQSNGNINWDDGFERLIDFLHHHLVKRSTLSDEMKLSVLADLSRLRNFLPVDQLEDHGQDHQLPYVDDDLYDRLTLNVVEFARLNTTVIRREADPDLHR